MSMPNRTIPKLPFSERSPHRFLKKKYVGTDKVEEPDTLELLLDC